MHVHSVLSDGTFSYRELIDLCAVVGLKGLSITDHDIISTEISDIKQYAVERGILFIHGIEFSTEISNVHILGYNMDLKDSSLWKFLHDEQEKRSDAIREMCLRAQKNNLDVQFEEVEREADSGAMGRPHIAAVMQKKGYVRDIYEAFHKYLKKGQPVYVDYQKKDHADIVKKILQWKGIPVLAHLSLVAKDLQDDIFHECRETGLRGLEVYYPRFNEQQTNKLMGMAKEYKLLISGGSDFHGINKPDIELGSAGLTDENFTHNFGFLIK